jgi:hypothetical protein
MGVLPTHRLGVCIFTNSDILKDCPELSRIVVVSTRVTMPAMGEHDDVEADVFLLAESLSDGILNQI